MEFVIDINMVMYVYIDCKKKFLVMMLMWVIGYDMDKVIFDIFDFVDEVFVICDGFEKVIGCKLVVWVL